MMRLLEFNRDDSGANPRRSFRTTTSVSPAPADPAVRRGRIDGLSPPASGRVFPVAGNTLVKPARHSPVDLPQLQARVASLEKRLQSRSGRLDEQDSVEELQRLQQRMQRLEQDLETELWAALQREHTLLELLSRPPLKRLLQNRIRQFWQTDLPAAGRWTRRMLQLWWLDVQPRWWPGFARAWQESLDKARR